ncbi:MAG: trehalose-6-phosphate synthase [Actinobacteria bacterium]|nr:trehalose-6-phosphate synthase [Actinomycetota bacterium]
MAAGNQIAPDPLAESGATHLTVVSNRGPVSFEHDESGELVARDGAGGLVSALRPLLAGSGATWVASAITEADREATARGWMTSDGLDLVTVASNPEDYAMAYDVISNGTLWFLHHHLFDLSRRPRIDARWWEAWEAYRVVNGLFANVIAERSPEGGTVLIQDYHLSLVGAALHERRDDLLTSHFSHTPFCSPEMLRVLPDPVARELLESLSAVGARGFHTRRWGDLFTRCTQSMRLPPVTTFASPLSPDVEHLKTMAGSAESLRARQWLDEQVGDRKVVLQVARAELSKNLLRGLSAFDLLLEEHPEWRERAVHVILANPSRQMLADYVAYQAELEHLVQLVNERWATSSWTPILMELSNDYPRSIAALGRYDVLLVNPLRDGLNLVAKEGPVVNERSGAVVLSREAGVWEELAGLAIEINPFDIAGTASAILSGLTMPEQERSERSEGIVHKVISRPAAKWLADQCLAATGKEESC